MYISLQYFLHYKLSVDYFSTYICLGAEQASKKIKTINNLEPTKYHYILILLIKMAPAQKEKYLAHLTPAYTDFRGGPKGELRTCDSTARWIGCTWQLSRRNGFIHTGLVAYLVLRIY